MYGDDSLVQGSGDNTTRQIDTFHNALFFRLNMKYRPSSHFRFLPLFGSLGFLAFAVLGVIVAVDEDAAMGWWVARGAK